MTQAELLAAIDTGIELAFQSATAGCDLLGFGEMGIGNTTSASAIAAERWLGRELAKQQSGVEYWHAKARTAVAGNRDDLARLALARAPLLAAKDRQRRRAGERMGQRRPAVSHSCR